MSFYDKIDFSNLVGHHSLIYGETNTGKTLHTAKFIQYLLENKKFKPKEISILDFAPRLTYIKHLKVGGRIQDYYKDCLKCNIIHFDGEIIPPRLNARSKNQLYSNICKNFKKIYTIIGKYNCNPTPVLIINDISIYLHLGKSEHLINTIHKSSTFLGNTYYGTSITSKFSKLVSVMEKKKVEYLIKNIETSFKTT